MSAMSGWGEGPPPSSQRLLGEGEGGEDVPRDAWPVLLRPSWRAERRSRNQLVSTPSATMARRGLATPSPSEGLGRRPRRRGGSSVTVEPLGEVASPGL